MPHIKKEMSDLCSATLKTPRNAFLRENFLGPQFRRMPTQGIFIPFGSFFLKRKPPFWLVWGLSPSLGPLKEPLFP